MQLFWNIRTKPFQILASTRIHPALIHFADECSGTLARLIAYVGALALLAIAGVHAWDQLPAGEPMETATKAGWRVATRPYPAFAVSQSELVGKTASYEVFRHPEGGRKDVLRWATVGETPIAGLELYRPGVELTRSEPAITKITERMDPDGARDLETAGVLDSKFGTVTLLRVAGPASKTPACLGFMKNLDQADLRISGWSCQGDTLAARRAAIGCILNRLTLLTAGNDPKLAKLFAAAELKRGTCNVSTGSADAAGWVTDAENPRLRGAF